METLKSALDLANFKLILMPSSVSAALFMPHFNNIVHKP